MSIARNGRILMTGVVVAALMTVAVAARAEGPQAVSGTYLEIETDGNGDAQMIKLSLGPDRMRMDMGDEMSMVSVGGDAGKMLMIQHKERSYLEFDPNMLAGMMGMMGQMPPEVTNEIEDTEPPTFTRTGNTKQVGAWNAYEVLVEHEDQDDVIMWFTQDLDVDFRDLAEQVMESMSSLLNNPMVSAMSGAASGGQGIFGQVESQLGAMEMPDGFPVQMISDPGGDESINTLKAIDQAASFEAATWEAPEGYEKMTIPFRR